MAPFKYGMIVDGENYCPRPELARQFSKLVAAGLNVVVQGERRMGKILKPIFFTRNHYGEVLCFSLKKEG